MHVAVDEPREHGEACRIDDLCVPRNLNVRPPAGVSYVSVLDEYGRFASGVAAGWIEKPVSVDSPNHG
jgi:hypothetical protein